MRALKVVRLQGHVSTMEIVQIHFATYVRMVVEVDQSIAKLARINKYTALLHCHNYS